MRPHKYTIPMFLLSFAGLASANPQASSLARMQSGRADGEPLRSPTAILDFTATSVQGTSVLGTPTQPSPQPDDQDRDGIADPKDNCPTAVNPGQEDSNANGVGDVCESTCETVWARPIADVGLNDDIDDFGDAQSAWIRTAWGPQDEKVGLFQFEDIKVPEYSQIANAAMIFFAVPTSSQSYVGLHRVLAEWDEVTAQDMDWTPDGKLWDRNAEYQFMAPGGYAVADVTSLVQGWVSGVWPNNGVLLAEAGYDRHTFATRDMTSSTLWPHLRVCYIKGEPPPPSLPYCPPSSPCEAPGIYSTALGGCIPVPAPDGTPCDDGNLCTTHAQCFVGACLPVEQVQCPKYGCMKLDVCDPGTGQCGEALPDGEKCDLESGEFGSCLAGDCVDPQCVDGVQGSLEDGVDCGGPCVPCPPPPETRGD